MTLEPQSRETKLLMLTAIENYIKDELQVSADCFDGMSVDTVIITLLAFLDLVNEQSQGGLIEFIHNTRREMLEEELR